MVFLIQKTQNKDSKAIQLKLNELVTASKLDLLHKFYQKLSDKAKEEDDIHKSHSIDNAENYKKRSVQINSSTNLRSRLILARQRFNPLLLG